MHTLLHSGPVPTTVRADLGAQADEALASFSWRREWRPHLHEALVLPLAPPDSTTEYSGHHPYGYRRVRAWGELAVEECYLLHEGSKENGYWQVMVYDNQSPAVDPDAEGDALGILGGEIVESDGRTRNPYKRAPGRPSLSADEPTERLTVRFPASQAATLRADPRGASRAIRDAIELVNRIAGSGQHSHPVPTAELSSVLMRDGQHEGTLLTLLPDGRYLVSSLDWGTAKTCDRLLLVQGGSWEQGDQPVACDSESPDGLAFYADDYEGEGEILWDSAPPPFGEPRLAGLICEPANLPRLRALISAWDAADGGDWERAEIEDGTIRLLGPNGGLVWRAREPHFTAFG